MSRVIILFLSFFLAFSTAHAASGKPAPKVDCSVKKNQKKVECKKPPESKVKVDVKKPKKVTRKAPRSVKKKAKKNLKEK